MLELTISFLQVKSRILYLFMEQVSYCHLVSSILPFIVKYFIPYIQSYISEDCSECTPVARTSKNGTFVKLFVLQPRRFYFFAIVAGQHMWKWRNLNWNGLAKTGNVAAPFWKLIQTRWHAEIWYQYVRIEVGHTPKQSHDWFSMQLWTRPTH